MLALFLYLDQCKYVWCNICMMLFELYDVNFAMLRMQISFWSLPTSDKTFGVQ